MITRFVTATGTGLGKTLVTAALCHQLRSKGTTVRALKPIVTGLSELPWAESDPGILLKSMGTELPHALSTSPVGRSRRDAQAGALDCISPFRFAAALAPSMAAALEDRSLDLDAVLRFCRTEGPEDVRLIEGVGGVMVPLAPGTTVLDWIKALRCSAILVTGSYLGSLSHTLTALAVLRGAAVPLAGLVVSASADSTVGLEETAAELRLWAGRAPVLALPRIAGPEPWLRAPDLTSLV